MTNSALVILNTFPLSDDIDNKAQERRYIKVAQIEK
jgi:hypothetical protein